MELKAEAARGARTRKHTGALLPALSPTLRMSPSEAKCRTVASARSRAGAGQCFARRPPGHCRHVLAIMLSPDSANILCDMVPERLGP